MPITKPITKRYYPSLSEVITVDDLPEFLHFAALTCCQYVCAQCGFLLVGVLWMFPRTEDLIFSILCSALRSSAATNIASLYETPLAAGAPVVAVISPMLCPQKCQNFLGRKGRDE